MTGRPPRQTKRSRSRSGRKAVSVSIIGAGRLGTALAIALNRAGHSIALIVARHAASARRANKLSGGQAKAASLEQFRRTSGHHSRLLAGNSLIIIATPDDAIGSVAEDLALLTKANPRRTMPGTPVALHTSGALSSEVLAPLRRRGASVGSAHPLVSISDPSTGADWLTRAYFSLEGDAAAVRLGRQVVQDLGGRTFTINAQTKPLYHAAALMASPNMTALVDVALEMLNRCGLPPDRSRKVLLPLIESTLANLATQTPERALTGTFKRGDIATVRKHLEAISSSHLWDALEAYVLLGRRSLQLSRDEAPNRTLIEQILGDALDQTYAR